MYKCSNQWAFPVPLGASQSRLKCSCAAQPSRISQRLRTPKLFNPMHFDNEMQKGLVRRIKPVRVDVAPQLPLSYSQATHRDGGGSAESETRPSLPEAARGDAELHVQLQAELAAREKHGSIVEWHEREWLTLASEHLDDDDHHMSGDEKP